MAFGKTTFTLLALVSATALVTSVGCSDDTTSTTLGTGGSGTGAQGGMGTGATGGGGNGTGAQGGGTGGGATTDCATLCADNVANCDSTNTQWVPGASSCEAFCTLWDQGTPGEMAGDTIECRAYHTGAAASDAATHCPHGGPYGGGVCGASQCENFCAAMQLLCTGTNEQYASEAECLTACGGLADNAMPFKADPDVLPTGATFACRGYHLTAAALDPVTHCGHAAGVGACD